MTTQSDVVVIGAGIAGMSAGAEIAANATVTILERESQPGYHSTGRSAAYLHPGYGNATVQAISEASQIFYFEQPEGFSETPLARPRGILHVAAAEHRALLEALKSPLISVTAARDLVPILDTTYLDGAVVEYGGADLDVDATLQGFRRRLKSRGGQLVVNAEVSGLRRAKGLWYIDTSAGSYAAPQIVNAAGAWADSIAELAGLNRLGLVPKRRTVMLLALPADCEAQDWPMVVHADEQFYFKPDAGALLLSPADETPSPACDAQPEELDVATAVARFEQATTLKVSRITHRWAGLRTFAPDNTFVVGFDPRCDGFCWLAGQGGYGVQSAPALAQLTAALVTGMAPAPAFGGVLDFRDAVAPERLL